MSDAFSAVTISRNTLYFRDQIIFLKEQRAQAEQVWTRLAVLPLGNFAERAECNAARSELIRITKALDNAVSCFADSAFMDLRSIK